jgi:hypothetical protein
MNAWSCERSLLPVLSMPYATWARLLTQLVPAPLFPFTEMRMLLLVSKGSVASCRSAKRRRRPCGSRSNSGGTSERSPCARMQSACLHSHRGAPAVQPASRLSHVFHVISGQPRLINLPVACCAILIMTKWRTRAVVQQQGQRASGCAMRIGQGVVGCISPALRFAAQPAHMQASSKAGFG